MTGPDELKSTAWQPIETAPRDGRRLLLWNGGAQMVAHLLPAGAFFQVMPGAGECGADAYTDWYNEDCRGALTHWMALPESPK